MATDLERLVVQLSADIKKYENALSRAQGQTTRRFNAIQKQATSSSIAIAASLARTGAKIAAAFVFSSAVRNLTELSDAATRIDNSLKVVGVTGQELSRVFDKLFASATANGAPIESLATLFGRASLAQKELGVSTDELLAFTNNVAVALRVAGTDAQTASGSLLQLGQALGSGRVMAEEFNSILEGTPTIARAVAAGLKEANGSVSQLKTLVVDGKVSSEAFFRAFEAGSVTLQSQAEKSDFTISQSMTNLQNSLIKIVGEFNKSTGASERFAGGINSVAEAAARFDVSGLIAKIQELNKEFEDYLANLKVFETLNQMTGTTDAEGRAINVDKTKAEADIASLEKELRTLQERIAVNTDLGFDNTEALARIAEVTGSLAKLRAQAANMQDTVPGYRLGENGIEPIPEASQTNGQMGGSRIRGGARRRAVEPVSIADFKPPPGSKTSSSKAPNKTAEDRFSEDVQAIRDRTAALVQEQQIIGQTYFEQEKRRMALDLEQQALRDVREEARKKGDADWQNAQLTPEHIAKISALSAEYAKQANVLRDLEEAQYRAESSAQDFYDTARSGFVDVLRGTSSLSDALSNLASKFADLALNSAFDSLFGGTKATSGGGWLTNLFKGLGFSSGGYTGDGGKYQPAGVVHKGEYVFDKASVKAAGGPASLEAMRRSLKGYSKGGSVGVPVPSIPTLPPKKPVTNAATQISFAPTIDARGADAEAVARIDASLKRTQRDLKATILSTVREAPNSNIKLR